MADISQITTLDGTTYDVKAIRSNSVPIATVDSTSTSTAFTVQVPEFANETELRDGMFFYIYNNKVASASGWTLNVNNLGAKPVYNASAERTTTGFSKTRWFPIWYSSTLINGGCWIIGYLTDANTTYSVFSAISHGQAGYLADSVVYRYQLLFQMNETEVTPLNNNSNSTGTSKTMLTSVEFDPFGEILYYNTTTTVSAGSRIAGNNCLFYATLDLRYTFNCGSTLTAFAPVYLKVSLQSNGKVKLVDSTAITQTLPSTNDGYYYIFLGRTYSAYQMCLYCPHPVYYHDGTKIRELIDLKKEPTTVNGHTVNSDVPSNAGFLPSVSSSDNGKILRVVDGAWGAVQLVAASGVDF